MDVLNNFVFAANVAWATLLSGVLSTLGIIDANASRIAVFTGIILSFLLIAVNVQNFIKQRLEIQLLRRRKEDKERLRSEPQGKV